MNICMSFGDNWGLSTDLNCSRLLDPNMVTGTGTATQVPGGHGTMDPDMTLGSSKDPDINMASGDSTGRSHQYGFKQKHGL